MKRSKPWILGVSTSHNGAACLLHGNRIIAAVQEERLLRTKRARLHGARSTLAIRYCLDAAKITPGELNAVVQCSQTPTSLPSENLRLNPIFSEFPDKIRFYTISHHMGHAISAYATSGFSNAAILVIDGMGSPVEDLSSQERAAVVGNPHQGWETTSLYTAKGRSVQALEKHLVPNGEWIREDGTGMPEYNSLGGLYGAVATQIFGDSFEGAGKVMGLAPFGDITIPWLDFLKPNSRGYFSFSRKLPSRFPLRIEWPRSRKKNSDLAASVQAALEEAILLLCRRLRQSTGLSKLCYAGGVALNSVTNERIVRESGFEDVWFVPAAEDSGTAIGAAYWGLWHITKSHSPRFLERDAVGKTYTTAEIKSALKQAPAIRVTRPSNVIRRTAKLLQKGAVIGWFDGGSELGPRALGQRSILCDPRDPEMQNILNSRVKHREGFRPFAPVILLEEAKKWFDFDGTYPDSPFMLRVAAARPDKRHLIPAVIHVDGSARVQTVTAKRNGKYYALVREFFRLTGVPVLLNTSFNVAGEPIVETPDDALWSLISTGIDYVIMGSNIIGRKQGFSSILELPVTLNCQRVNAELGSGADSTFASFINRSPTTLTECLPIMDEEDLTFQKPQNEFLPRLRLEIATRWGTTVKCADLRLMSFLDLVNGNRTGSEILKTWSRQCQRQFAQKDFLTFLMTLKRSGIISFATPQKRRNA